MPLPDFRLAVSLGADGTGGQFAAVLAQSHGVTQIFKVLILHQSDDGIGRIGVHFSGIGHGQAQFMPGKFDHGHLHSKAQAQEGQTILPRVADRGHFTFQSAGTEAAGHHQSIRVLQQLGGVFVRHRFRGDPKDVRLHTMENTAVLQRLHHAQVRVGQLHIFAHQRDIHLFLAAQLAFHHGAPLGQIRFRRIDAQKLQHLVVQMFRVQKQRHLIQAAGVLIFKYAVLGHIAEHTDLCAHFFGNGAFGPANQNIRCDAQPGQFLHAVLGRLGFQFVGRVQVRYQRHVDIQAVVPSHLGAHLADGLQKRLAFNIAHGAADFGDNNVGRVLRAGNGEDAILDFVGNVGNDLHRRAQILAPAFPVDDGLVDTAAGHVAALTQVFVDEALVVAKVKVRLRTVVGHEHLAMLVRVHRTRVHVNIGIQLLHRDAQSPQLQQPSQRRRRNALSQRRNHAAGNKNVLRLHPEHSPRI